MPGSDAFLCHHRRGDWTRPGPVTVITHGGGPGCHALADFGAVAERLGDRPVLLVDLPGYGGSALPVAAGPRYASMAAALWRLLAALGITAAHLVGQSLGGPVSLHLAATEPGLVRRIVLIGAQEFGEGGGTPVGARAREKYYADPNPEAMRELMATLEWHDPTRIPGELVEKRYRASITAASLAVAGDPARRGTPDSVVEYLPRVAAPVLFVWGSDDPFGSPERAVSLRGLLPRADAVVLGGTAHHPQSERPGEVAAFITTFLDIAHGGEQ
ncbi:alpha/beta fold hydrolase [Amycolatopsis sp. GM8]|uniref:alpha/beta fold hydrolase n=1 Tax=Amycolatopsis sp. GM8 TaxID=2896530 RepID=UPI001F45F4D6|nr:alpha/beta hydrolase [Amycolatopsis sp. GM8]